MIGRIVRSTDFERVLGAPTRARSPHFAAHHLAGRPSLPGRPAEQAPEAELSTAVAPLQGNAVDDLAAEALCPQLWLGAVVPKRHARRAVTRSLLKRQIRAALDRHDGLPGGLWVVRLRAPFDADRFASAASRALRDAARAELDAMLAAIVRRPALR
ncbi:ribonuclease P protein component [Piscinibacter sp.]|uniref:ribonuclease P protein component n=1 Tax=Piscinibacter sp. TaxID=1903157 RepID=UPI002F404A3C